jgi:hypothetical protein
LNLSYIDSVTLDKWWFSSILVVSSDSGDRLKLPC